MNELDIKGWAQAGFLADGTPTVCNSIRHMHDTPPFAEPFKKQFLAPNAPPLTLFGFAAPGTDGGPNHPAHVDIFIAEAKAILKADPTTQLIVCGCARPRFSPLTRSDPSPVQPFVCYRVPSR